MQHDATLRGVGRSAHRPTDQVPAFRLANGEPVPHLAEALEIIGDRDVWIELKGLDARFDNSLLTLLDRGPAPNRYAVHAFDHRIIARLGRERPALRRGILLSSYLLDPVAPLTAIGARTLWQEQHLIDPPLVEQVHASGFGIVAWTVNAPDDVARLIRAGVDALCGNYPDRLRQSVDG